MALTTAIAKCPASSMPASIDRSSNASGVRE
jgi:hypothetical protein